MIISRRCSQLFLFILVISFITGMTPVNAQTNLASGKPKVMVYYFHPDERCPIDQSIEENTVKLIYTDFGKEIREGTLIFQVINTDEKANEKFVSGYDINAQALYVVKIDKGKEIKKDLTKFAFDWGQSNPAKFRAGLKEEVEKALGRGQ